MNELKVVSFSLWGDKPMYTRGAVSNLVMGKRLYPNFTYRFYMSEELYDGPLASELESRGAEVRLGNPRGEAWRVGLYWRLDALLDTKVDVAIFRDADSRPSAREAAAVNSWIESGLPVHVMRDHRFHTAPIMGGMWGCHPKKVKRLVKGLRVSLNLRMDYALTASIEQGKSKHGRYAFSDQDWLADVVWPKVKDKTLEHIGERAVSKGAYEARAFTAPPQSPQHFVGQAYSVQGAPKWEL